MGSEAEVENRRTPTTMLSTATAAAKQRLELVAFIAIVLGITIIGRLTSGRSIPPGVFVVGMAGGASLAIQAIGIVLVYRSNRIINFAQVQLGMVGGTLFFELVRRRTLLLPIHVACGCMKVTKVSVPPKDVTTVTDVPGWLLQANYWVSLLVALAVVGALGFITYMLVIRRFGDAPRLIATVVTIGLADVFTLINGLIPRFFGAPNTEVGTVPFPFHLNLSIGKITMGTTDIVTLVVAGVAVAVMTLFFARTAIGVVLRGASENPQRAETLGVNISSVTATVWVAAGLLSGIGAILGVTSGGLGAAPRDERLLAVAVVAGLVSIPVTVVAGALFGVMSQVMGWTFNAPPMVTVMSLVVIVTALLLQRARSTRVDTEADAGWKPAREVRPTPPQLLELDVVRRWRRTGTVLGAAAVLTLPWILSPSQTTLASVTLSYGIVAMSLLVLTGWAGQISLGHFAFAAVGAWVTAVVQLPFPIPLLLAGAVGAAVATAIGLPALRLRGMHLAVSTLAFAVAVPSVLLNDRYLGRSLPASLSRPRVLGLDLDEERIFFYFMLLALALVVLAVIGMRRSRSARALIAARDNEPGAQTFGINLVRARLGAFAVSGFLAAVAGGLFAYSQHAVDLPSFTVDTSIAVFLMVVIGGLGSVSGPLLGAAYFGALEIFGEGNPLLRAGGTGLGVVVLLLFVPAGLGDLVFRIRDALLRRVADRYRIDVPSLVGERGSRGTRRLAIAPRTRSGGGHVFTPVRYRAAGQWSIEARRRAKKEAADA